ncbi:MAG: class I tRNA ligase family protein [bacterium]|nr:class I tRNA ligase family protein [bacterium]
MKGGSLLLPPPNVTGTLHLGHAYCFHLSYMLCELLRIKSTYGADHAGLSAYLRVDSSRILTRSESLRRL